MIIHQSAGLHVRINYRAAHKLKPAFDQVFAKRIRLVGGGRNLFHGFPFVYDWLVVYKPPDVFVEGTKLFLHFQKPLCIIDSRIHFQFVADDIYL